METTTQSGPPPLLEWSETFGKIALALAQAQASFPAIEKNRTAYVRSEKGNYQFDYADLAAVLGAVTPSLSRAGIALLQPVVNNGDAVTVQTWLVHGESGEWIRSRPLALPGGREVKQLGGAITYLRRYQLGALLGVAPEDDVDDGTETRPRAEARQVPPPPDAQQPGGRFRCAHGHQHTAAEGAKGCKGDDKTLEPGEDPPSMAAPAVDHAAACRKAIAEKDWRGFLSTIGRVQASERKRLEAEYQAARYPTPTPEARS